MASGPQARQQSAYGVSLYSPLGTLSPLFVSNYASTRVREALAACPASARSDVWRPGLQHAHLAAPGPHERAQHHHG